MSARDAALAPLSEAVRTGVEATCKRVGHVSFAMACGIAPSTLRIALEGKPIKAVTHGAIESGLLKMAEPTRTTSYDHPSKPYWVAPATDAAAQRERSYMEGRRRAYLDTPSSTDQGDDSSSLDTDRYVSACEHCPCAQSVASDQYVCGLDSSIAWEDSPELHVPPDACPMRRGVVRLRLAP